jgi:hypothetical protein
MIPEVVVNELTGGTEGDYNSPHSVYSVPWLRFEISTSQ